MKTMSKIFGIVTVLTLTLFLTSSTIAPTPDAANNGTVVNVVKNGGWTIFGGCIPAPILENSSTTQYKNGQVHMITVKWDLSGTCLVGSSAQKINIGTPFGPGTLNITPSGMAIMKLIAN